jgi:hypothetical protein
MLQHYNIAAFTQVAYCGRNKIKREELVSFLFEEYSNIDRKNAYSSPLLFFWTIDVLTGIV